jgi:hypothetical protein
MTPSVEAKGPFDGLGATFHYLYITENTPVDPDLTTSNLHRLSIF